MQLYVYAMTTPPVYNSHILKMNRYIFALKQKLEKFYADILRNPEMLNDFNMDRRELIEKTNDYVSNMLQEYKDVCQRTK